MNLSLQIKFKLLTFAMCFLLNIAEHENFSANKSENANYYWHFHIFSRENFMLSGVEHENHFITSGPEHRWRFPWLIRTRFRDPRKCIRQRNKINTGEYFRIVFSYFSMKQYIVSTH